MVRRNMRAEVGLVKSFDVDFEWCHGFRLGLWYYDTSHWDPEDSMWNFVVVIDMGIFCLRLWTSPKDEYFEEEE